MSDAGKTLVYCEDGGEWLVDVIEDSTEDGLRSVRVRCVRELRPSPMIAGAAPGDEWEASIAVGVCFGGMWTLRNPEPGELAS